MLYMVETFNLTPTSFNCAQCKSSHVHSMETLTGAVVGKSGRHFFKFGGFVNSQSGKDREYFSAPEAHLDFFIFYK